MTWRLVALQPPSVLRSSTRPRRRLGRAAAIAVAAVVVLSGCRSNDTATGATTRATPAEAGRATSPAHCNGAIGEVSVDDVHVPSRATCRLDGTTVNGNVSIGSGGTLVARRVAVDGDIEGQQARHVAVSVRSSIGGNLQLEQGGSAAVSRSAIHGDLQWTMHSGPLAVTRTVIDGNLQADQNSGGLIISGNRIGGDLQCHQNTRRPVRAGNVVAGHREGQCASDSRHSRPVAHQTTHSARPRPRCAGDSVSDDPSDDRCGED